jgi:hypothetical protein
MPCGLIDAATTPSGTPTPEAKTVEEESQDEAKKTVLDLVDVTGSIDENLKSVLTDYLKSSSSDSVEQQQAFERLFSGQLEQDLKKEEDLNTSLTNQLAKADKDLQTAQNQQPDPKIQAIANAAVAYKNAKTKEEKARLFKVIADGLKAEGGLDITSGWTNLQLGIAVTSAVVVSGFVSGFLGYYLFVLRLAPQVTGDSTSVGDLARSTIT